MQEGLFDMPALPAISAGTFRGGPLDGAHRRVPAYGPAWVRYQTPDAFHWYAFKSGSQRTYSYVGSNVV